MRHGHDSRHCAWSAIERVTALKRDLATYDCICLLIAADGAIFEIDEQMAGFAEVRVEMEKHLAIPPDWWAKVAFPAFAPCALEIYPHVG